MELKNEADSQLIKHIENNLILRSVLKVWSEETAQRYWGGLFQSLRSETLKAPATKHYKSELEYCKNVPGYVCNPGSPRERDAASKR